MTKEIPKSQINQKKTAVKITLRCIFAICSIVTLFTFIGEILSPKKVADGKIISLSGANYKLVDKDSSKTVDDPCIVKYSYSIDGKDISSGQQFQSKTACIDFPLEEDQKIQVQYEVNNIEESNIQSNGKYSESTPWSALLISVILAAGAIIILKPKKQPKI